MGNICRSPLAEGLFRKAVAERGLSDLIDIDSAGTGSWHVGEPPDRRMQETALKHGVDLSGQSARQFESEDLAIFDHIFVMDRDNLNDVLYLDREERFGGKVRLFREFDPEPDDFQVPDPYYGGDRGFDNVYAIVKRTADVLLDRLVEEFDLRH
jgi:protein-tyrosine phosphatase